MPKVLGSRFRVEGSAGENMPSNPTCNLNNLQFYGLYLLIKGYLLLNCRLLEPQVNPTWTPKPDRLMARNLSERSSRPSFHTLLGPGGFSTQEAPNAMQPCRPRPPILPYQRLLQKNAGTPYLITAVVFCSPDLYR